MIAAGRSSDWLLTPELPVTLEPELPRVPRR
jgi:hypothetical protein